MKKLERKLNWALTLSAVSLMLVVAIIGLWIFKSQEIAVITLDTFVGVIVALLAIIVTTAIGWQILNAMDIRNKVREVEGKVKLMDDVMDKTNKQQEKLSGFSLSIKHLLDLTWAEQSLSNSNFENTFYYCVRSLQSTMQLPHSVNVDKILILMTSSVDGIKNGHKISVETYSEIKQADTTIRQQNCFCLIKGRYEKLYKQFFQKVKVEEQK